MQTIEAPGERTKIARAVERQRDICMYIERKKETGKVYGTFASVRLFKGATGRESSGGRQRGTQRSLALVCSLYAVRVACEESTTKSVMLSQSGAAAPYIAWK